MDRTVACPSCRHPLLVPDAYVGRPVQCPACGSTFVAMAARPPAPAAERPPRPEPEPVTVPVVGDTRERHVKRLVAAPAVCLIILGAMGFLTSLAVLTGLRDGTTRAELHRQAAMMDPQQRAAAVQAADLLTGRAALILQWVLLTFALGVILGAFQMLRRRGYGLAVTASVLAMTLNPYTCCCMLGIPVGAWALTVLLRPEVRAAFR